jgi:outer membrane protein assembly factor BamB
VAAKIGDVDVLVTPNGEFVRIADGKVLANIKNPLEYNAPAIDGGYIYFIQGNSRALKIPIAVADMIAPENAWNAKIKNDRYYASPVIHDGLLYAVTQAGELSVLDVADGKVIYARKLDLPNTVYPSVTLAGKNLYISNDKGTTIVMEPGREYKELKRNVLEPFRCCPVFLGKRMYVRGFQHLYCIGE